MTIDEAYQKYEYFSTSWEKKCVAYKVKDCPSADEFLARVKLLRKADIKFSGIKDGVSASYRDVFSYLPLINENFTMIMSFHFITKHGNYQRSLRYYTTGIKGLVL